MAKSEIAMMKQTLRGESSNRAAKWRRPVVGLAIVAGGVYLFWKFGIFDELTVENIELMDAWFESLGLWAPLVFILAWVAAAVFFLPGLAMTIVGGLVFGAVWGTVWTTIGANLGAIAAFLIGRYAARGMVEGMVEKNPTLQKIDRGVRKQGWRMLMITRLVPIFPFNVQNYVYGLTDVPLKTYVLVTLPCMLPATIAYTFAAGSVRTGDFGKTLWYLGIAASAFVVLSLIPNWVRRRFAVDELES